MITLLNNLDIGNIIPLPILDINYIRNEVAAMPNHIEYLENDIPDKNSIYMEQKLT